MGGRVVKNRKPMTLADYPQFHEAQRIAREHGQTIGRLEGIADAMRCARPGERWFLSGESCAVVLPVLRAEIERLKGAAQ